MGTMPPQLGEPLDDDLVIYRAFAAKGFRERPSRVRAKAYYRHFDHTDGLSLGRTPIAAVSGLDDNFGYASIRVGDIRAMGMEVRVDAESPDHILLCKIPPIDGTDEQRDQASRIAGALARASKVESCDHYPPKDNDILPSPLP